MHTIQTRASLCAAALLLWPAGPLAGQQLLERWTGNTSSDYVGSAVAGAGDIDGDGVPDVIVGALQDEARVFSGADGSLLYARGVPLLVFGQVLNSYGPTVRGVGDVNADGRDDFAVGRAGIDFTSGQVRVFSGLDGALLHQVSGAFADLLGVAIAALGDVDGDGHADFAAGAAQSLGHPFPEGPGKVTAYSGATGDVLYSASGDQVLDGFGVALAALDDVDGDGVPDLLVGTSGDHARVISGLDGATLHTCTGPAFSQYGRAVAAVDVNGDGQRDLVIGSRLRDQALPDVGRVEVYSGADLSLLFEYAGTVADENLGGAVGPAGDANGDGHGDFLMAGGRPFDGGSPLLGFAQLMSGRTGERLYALRSTQHDHFGIAVDAAGDVNGDGNSDFVIGASLDAGSLGRADLYAGADLFLDTDPGVYSPGDSVTWSVREGDPGDLAALFIVAADGFPFVTRLFVAPMDARGALVLNGTVLPESSGHSLTLKGYALTGGKLVQTASQTVTFQ